MGGRHIFNDWSKVPSLFSVFVHGLVVAALEKIAQGKMHLHALHVVVIFAINFVPTAFALFKQTARASWLWPASLPSEYIAGGEERRNIWQILSKKSLRSNHNLRPQIQMVHIEFFYCYELNYSTCYCQKIKTRQIRRT